jgi:hypothetical protein
MPWPDRWLLLESLTALAAARVLVKTGGKRLIARLRQSRIENPEPTDGTAPVSARQLAENHLSARIGYMIERAARTTLWRSMCLEKALAGQWMLKRRGIPSTMYIGAAKQDGKFVAHAWLVGEGQTVTGGGRVSYATLAAFREAPRAGGGPIGNDSES